MLFLSLTSARSSFAAASCVPSRLRAPSWRSLAITAAFVALGAATAGCELPLLVGGEGDGPFGTSPDLDGEQPTEVDWDPQPLLAHLAAAPACSEDGWCWMRPGLEGEPGHALHEVHGRRSNNVWAVGAGGLLVHHDGTMWAAYEVEGMRLTHVHATSQAEVYLYGLFEPEDENRSLRLSPEGLDRILVGGQPARIWETSFGELTAITNNGLYTRAATDPTDPWTLSVVPFEPSAGDSLFTNGAGDIWVRDTGLLAHREDDGPWVVATWPPSSFVEQHPELEGHTLHADPVGTVAPDGTLWIVGRTEAEAPDSRAYWLLRFRDGDWAAFPEANVAARSLAATDDVLYRLAAGGVEAITEGSDGEIERRLVFDTNTHPWAFGSDDGFIAFDDALHVVAPGGTWLKLDPATDAWTLGLGEWQHLPLLSVWGSGPDELWAVGYRGLRHRFDGSTWVPEPTTGDLFDVHGRSREEVYVTGHSSRVLRRSGETWTETHGPGEYLIDFQNIGPGRLIAGGCGLWDVDVDADVWTEIDIEPALLPVEPASEDCAFRVNDVLWLPDDTLFIVLDAGSLQEVVLVREGGQWTQLEAPLERLRLDHDGQTLWAVDDDGEVFRREGNALVEAGAPMPPSPGYYETGLGDVYGLHARAPNDIWVHGWQGYVRHFDGETWTLQKLGAGHLHITSLWATESHVTAVGTKGLILMKAR